MNPIDLGAFRDRAIKRDARRSLIKKGEVSRATSESLPPNQLSKDTNIRALIALVTAGKHIYAGTVPYAVVQRRRAANKVARRSRRVNRLSR